tara:strand:- start:1177 stop:1935 length:759 start_codon:yes stop_codon:yes gene_type:complete
MKKPELAILDGDILAWKAAFVAEEEGSLAISNLLSGLVHKWTPKGATDVVIALSCDKKHNFRRDVFPAYKDNRKDVYKPEHLTDCFDALKEEYSYLIYPKLEADDVLGIFCSEGEGISVTIDKDLRGVKGWHLNPEKEKEPVFISEEQAERWFCTQWMAGDSTDGIPGLWRVGVKTAEKFLDEWDTEDWHSKIRELYTEGKHVPQKEYEGVDDLYTVMGQCVRILSWENYDKDTQIITMWTPKDGLLEQQEI